VKVKARSRTPSESSMSGLEDAERRKRVKRPRVKVTYQPSEGGTEDGSPVHSSSNEGSSKAHSRDKEAEDEYKLVSRSTKEKAITRPLESSRKANAQRNTSYQPLTKRDHLRGRSKLPLPPSKQIIRTRSVTPLEVRPVSGSKPSSGSRQVTHQRGLSSDDDLNLFACSSPR